MPGGDGILFGTAGLDEKSALAQRRTAPHLACCCGQWTVDSGNGCLAPKGTAMPPAAQRNATLPYRHQQASYYHLCTMRTRCMWSAAGASAHPGGLPKASRHPLEVSTGMYRSPIASAQRNAEVHVHVSGRLRRRLRHCREMLTLP